MITIEEILPKLSNVRKNGNGYMATCPSHKPDKRPSLKISLGDAGTILLFCHTGCELDAVCAAIGVKVGELFPTKSYKPNTKSRIVAEYDYRDETGSLRFQVVRSEPKTFFQRRPNGNGWIYDLKGVRRVIYGLPELLKADKSFSVFIVEGEKDVESLRSIGAVATCNSGGAGKWKDQFSESLKGYKCVILPDNDEAGEQHAQAVSKSLLPHAESVNILRLPDLPDKGDVSDWIAKGNTSEDLYALLSGAETINKGDELETPTTDKKAKSRQKADSNSQSTQASRLMALAEDVELFHTVDGEGFATISVNSHKETFPLRSGDFRNWLRYQYWHEERSVPSSQSVQDVIHGLGGKAAFEGETRAVSLRIAESGGNLYLDLANDRWQCVEITKDGWNVVDNSPVKFRRTRGTMPFPVPERGGDIDELRRFANVNDEDWSLLLAWLVAAFRPNKPFPVLVLHGEQGSGKSTTAKVLRLLSDPNKSPLRSSPKDERDLMIAANNSWVISLDNLSSMSVTLSDALCRLSTGGGFSTRELFSDGDEILMSLMRPIILNGIDEVISRSDLLDRSILLHLPRLSQRFDETTFWSEFEAARPRLLGSLLDAVSVALSEIDAVTKTVRAEKMELPRLADFTLWGMAAEAGLGSAQGQFLDRYRGNREAVHDLVLDCDPFAEAITNFMDGRIADSWKGTASELLELLSRPSTSSNPLHRMKGFPMNPKSVGRRLQLLTPNLREKGIECVPPDRNHTRERGWTLQRNEKWRNSEVE